MAALNWSKITHPIIALSPMADMTDSAFCRVVREVTDVGVTQAALSARSPLVVFREMVSAEAVVRGNNKTLDMTEMHPSERPLVQQLFGSDPDIMAEAAQRITAEHAPEAFDINMGCPVYKIVHNFNGCALMNEPERAANIVRAMKAVIAVPVSVKIRLGWEDKTQCIEFAKCLEDAGADLLTVHGRTKAQGYSGIADWEVVGKVKDAVRIPVLCNGDIHTAEKVAPALAASGCDGVLIARGALGNPWIFRDIAALLHNETVQPVSFQERITVVMRHLALHTEQYGEHSVPLFRKHLSWYFKGIPHMKAYKDAMMNTQRVDELVHVFQEAIATHDANDTTNYRPTLITKK